jgi:hypothetical protein
MYANDFSDDDQLDSMDTFRAIGPMATEQPQALPAFNLWHEASYQPQQESFHTTATHKSLEVFEPLSKNFEAFNPFVAAEAMPALPVATLKDAPEWIDRFSSFLSSEGPKQLMSRIEACLEDMGIDFQSKPLKFKIKAVVYASTLPTRIRIQLFKKGDDVLVEFQKREGDSRGNINTFQKVVAELGPEMARPCSGATGKPRCLPVFGQLPPAELPELAPAVESAAAARANVVECLVEMVSSGLDDQVREALSELVRISATGGACVVQQLTLDTVLCHLASADECISRCAAIILANTVQAVTVQRGQTVPLLDTLFEVLENPSTLVNADTKRHVSFAISALAKSHGACFRDAHVRTLSRFCCASDATLRTNINLAQTLVQ